MKVVKARYETRIPPKVRDLKPGDCFVVGSDSFYMVICLDKNTPRNYVNVVSFTSHELQYMNEATEVNPVDATVHWTYSEK